LKSKDLIINCKLAMNASLANLQVVSPYTPWPMRDVKDNIGLKPQAMLHFKVHLIAVESVLNNLKQAKSRNIYSYYIYCLSRIFSSMTCFARRLFAYTELFHISCSISASQLRFTFESVV
jgi:hypothetical protein